MAPHVFALVFAFVFSEPDVEPVPPSPPAEATPAPPTEPDAEPQRPRPTTATAALDQAAAAYEYGDMNLVVESARLVVDGAVPGNETNRADALRFLGIGLYLTGRTDGARVAFEELLRLRPSTHLDPSLTRPEVVAFFSQLRRASQKRLEQERIAARPSGAWSLLPPFGQFKNGDDTRAWIVLGAEALFLTAAIVTDAVPATWRNSDDTYGHCTDGPMRTCDKNATARTFKTLNHVSLGLLAATYVGGVVDSLLRRKQIINDSDLSESRWSFSLVPGGAFLHARY